MPVKRTAAQREASRRNGAKSKGPKTAAGKARSAANAEHLKSPISSLEQIPFLLECDDPDGFVQLFETNVRCLCPMNTQQLNLVRRITINEWLYEQYQNYRSLLITLEMKRQHGLRTSTGKELSPHVRAALAIAAEAGNAT
ncbi:MAG: hypothetical protein SFV54_01420, partial [Bryobacteraceae bacterium]|nr:hypothetical protein [Bryobacteraceae bacterium]